MHIVKKVFKIPCSHRLKKNLNRCQNLHGHNMTIEISLSSEELNEDNMVIDFSNLKSIIGDYLDKFDHSTIVNPTDHNLINYLTENNYRMEMISEVNSDIDPTAEVLSKYLYIELNKYFEKINYINKPTISRVSIWESDCSQAEYYE